MFLPIKAVVCWLILLDFSGEAMRAQAVGPAPDPELAAIGKTIDDAIGWFRTKDFARLFEIFDSGAELFIYHPDSGTTIRGFEAFRKNAGAFADPDFVYAGHALRDLQVHRSAGGDTAWFSALLEDCWSYRGKKGCWKDCRWTGVLCRRNGKWVIAQLHFSFARDTLLAETPFFEEKFQGPGGLVGPARTAEYLVRDGGPVLRLEGLLFLKELRREDFRLEVEILAEGPCYPGVAFHARDGSDYELAYPVPHASGQPDAIQYDPVFRGGNSWQLFNGPPYQKSAVVPLREWFTLRLNVHRGRVSVQVNDQDPLVVERLAHGAGPGGIGLWSYRPAFFRNLRVFPARPIPETGVRATAPADAVSSWRAPDGSRLRAGDNGVVDAGAALDPATRQAVLSRSFTLAEEADVTFGLGFSDAVVLRVDGEELFRGENRFRGFADLPSRGWVTPNAQTVRKSLSAGTHVVQVELSALEPFGCGFVLTAAGRGLSFPDSP